jgi:hypothetical protein
MREIPARLEPRRRDDGDKIIGESETVDQASDFV